MADNGWDALFAGLRDGAAGRPDQLVGQALRLGHDLAPATVGCSVTQFDGARYLTSVASTELARALDGAQYAASSGPCLNAVRERRPQRVDELDQDGLFPELATVARQHGVRSSLSLPVAGTAQPTGLNFYSGDPAAFAPDRTQAMAGLLARVMGRLPTLSGLPEPAVDRPAAGYPELARAREQGRRVAEAVESVMRHTGLNRTFAFAALVIRSREENTSIATVAQQQLDQDGGRLDG